MKSKHLLSTVVFTSVLVTMLLSGPTYAIKNGQPDTENNWPYVCWVATYPGEGPYRYLGTGSLIAPTVVLTAGHVADVGDPLEGAWANVSFATSASWPPNGSDWHVVEWWYTHPEYEIGLEPQLKNWISNDVGILILEEPVYLSEHAELPEAGVVDTLPMKQDVDLVGYGVQWQVHGGGPPYWDYIDFGYRYYSQAQLIASDHVLSDEFLRLTANPGQGKGGTCFGDSGSPILEAGSDTVLGVCSWGTNGNCAGVSYEQRIDIQEILDWINTFL